MSGRVFTRTMDDGVKITDPLDQRERVVEQEFCLHAHAHFMARNLDDAMAKLAAHFAEQARSDEGGKTFHAGQVTVGYSRSIHAEPVSEATH